MGLCGHTGLVVSMDDDGTIQTLESGSSQCNTENLSWIQTRTRSDMGRECRICLPRRLHEMIKKPSAKTIYITSISCRYCDHYINYGVFKSGKERYPHRQHL